jgi:hypothetical protein
MPNPLDALKRAYNWADESMVPEDTIQNVENRIDSPSLNRSPMAARAQGFLAGATGAGLRQLSPINLAGTAFSGVGGRLGSVLGRLGGAAEEAPAAIRGLANITPDVIHAAPEGYGQMMPSMPDVDALIGDMKFRGAKGGVPTSSRLVGSPTTTGASLPEFVPRGGEAAFNEAQTARQAAQPKMDYVTSKPPHPYREPSMNVPPSRIKARR